MAKYQLKLFVLYTRAMMPMLVIGILRTPSQSEFLACQRATSKAVSKGP